jgi:TRAP-type C4-dicarboxylate transport system permease small subunit
MAHNESSRGPVAETAEKLFNMFAGVEKFMLACSLGGMVGLVLVQIFLRNFYNSGVVGGDSIVKHLVLWVGFLGAGIATRQGSHIRIDVASKIFPQRAKPYLQFLVDIFSVVVCGILVYASYQFVSIEYEGGGTIPFFNIPVWMMEVVIPVGFSIITLRFAAQAVVNLCKIVKG